MGNVQVFGGGLASIVAFAAIAVTPPSAHAAVVMLNQVVTNSSGLFQSYSFTATTFATISAPTSMDGSFTGSLTDNSGVGASAFDVTYTAFIDAQPVFQMDGGHYSVGPGLSIAWSPQSFTSVFGPPVANEISIEIQFTLSPNASASFTSIFSANPSPAGFLLFAGPLLTSRRRRA